MGQKNLESVLKPKSIAIVGASTNPNAVGHEILKKALEFKYQGDLYAINPKADEILGVKCYKSILDLPQAVDLAVVVVPRNAVFTVIDQCNEKGIKGICVISAGFKEIGGEGVDLEEKLKEQCEKYGMTVVGPNCMGVMNTEADCSMNVTFAPEHPIPGNAAFVSQSGALGIAVLNTAKDMHLGLSQFVSMGNNMDVNGTDLLEYWAEDEATKLILMYLESITDPKKFREISEKTTKQKPVIVVKSGTSSAGAAAASSHTGALAGSDNAASALLEQAGIIREKSVLNMFETANAFSNCPLPKGKRIAILTNAGGPGIMCTDAAEEYGLEVVTLQEKTKDELRSFLPEAASVRNPVDTIAAVSTENYERSLNLLLEDENVDAVIALLVPLVQINTVEMASAMMKAQDKYGKPVLGVIMATDEEYSEIYKVKDYPPIPFYKFPESAAYALSRLAQYSEWKNKPIEEPKRFSDVDKSKVEKILKSVIEDNRTLLTTSEAMDVLAAYGVKTCGNAVATTVDEAVAEADRIGYPVVMKVLSKTITHKSDIGGVVVGIQSGDELRAAFDNMMEKADEHGVKDQIDAVMLQGMVKGKREIVIGSSTDPQFGQLIMFGLGGIFIEAMKDVIFKVNPINHSTAKQMIRGIRSADMLEDYRGLKGVDLDGTADQLCRISQLLSDFSCIDELDINPYIVTDDTGETMAVDGRIMLNVKTIQEYEQKMSLAGVCQ